MINNIKPLILLSFSATLVFGANIPNSSTINKDIKVPKNIQKNEKGLIEIDGIKKPLPSIIDDKSGEKIFVKGFNFTGNTKFTDGELKKLLKEYINKELSFNDLQNATTIITKAYRDKGYFVARAYLPMQKMQQGIVTIAIIEGKFGKFQLKNNSLVKDTIVQNIFNEIKKDSIISDAKLEKVMLIANDTPGVVVTKADIKPGEKTGQSDFDIETSPSAFYDGYIILDNHGSRYTGKQRVMMGMNLNSPFKIGDRISLTGLVSDGANLKYTNISYDSLLHPNGLRGGIEYTYSKYELTKEYSYLNANGSSKVLSIDLSYPIIRQRDNSLYSTLKFTNRENKDDIDSTNTKSQKELNVMSLGLEYDLNTFSHTLPTIYNIKGEYSYGNLSFEDDTSLTNDKAGADTNGNYSKIYLELLQAINITNNLSLETKLSYQHSLSNKNLDGSEDLSISGINGVKVYPSSEASGENGYIFSIESKYALPNIYDISSSVGVFYDRARVYMADNKNLNTKNIDLQDIGISYYATYKDLFVNSYLAWQLNSDTITSEPDYNSKFLFQAGWVF